MEDAAKDGFLEDGVEQGERDRSEPHAAKEIEGSVTELFTRRLDVLEPGTVSVEVVTLAGDVVRASSIRGTTERFHAWLPWGEWRRGLDRDGRLIGAALPAGPHGVERAGGPLPRLLATEVSPGFTIARTAGGIRVQSEEALPSSAGDDFLVRFWVNGRELSPAVRSDSSMRRAWWEPRSAHDIRLPLDFPWSAVGARKGDVVAVQVMYASTGSSPLNPRGGLMTLDTRCKIGLFLRLSNRLELTID